jgi:hypothetical protein
MLADAHFSLFIKAALAENWPNEEYDSLRITDCYTARVPGTCALKASSASNGIPRLAPGFHIFKLLSLSGFYEQQISS